MAYLGLDSCVSGFMTFACLAVAAEFTGGRKHVGWGQHLKLCKMILHVVPFRLWVLCRNSAIKRSGISLLALVQAQCV